MQSVIENISMEDVLKMRDALKACDPNWGIKLGTTMFPELTEIKAKSKVYSIVQNQLRHNKWRVMFILEGNKMLDVFKAERDQVSEIINELPQ